MSLLNWNENYSVKVEVFDNQHKKLVEIINELHEAMRAGKSKDVLDKIFGELIDYTVHHFAAEETLMKKHAFPGYETHKAEHEELTQQALKLQADFKSGRAMLSLEVMEFLKKWLLEHIMGTDAQYSDFLQAHGVK